MADRLFEATRGGTPRAGGADLLRLDPLQFGGDIADVSFSGGVSEYIYGGEAKGFGDLGPLLAEHCGRGCGTPDCNWRGRRRASAPP